MLIPFDVFEYKIKLRSVAIQNNRKRHCLLSKQCIFYKKEEDNCKFNMKINENLN